MARDIRSLIFHLKARGVGVLITDHNWRETLALVERVYVLSEGRILVEGKSEDVSRDERFIRDYLGEDSGGNHGGLTKIDNDFDPLST